MDDLQGVPGGEVGVALIEPKPGEAATATVIDVTGHLEQANGLVAKATANLLKAGATQSHLRSARVPRFRFPCPREHLPAAARAAVPSRLPLRRSGPSTPWRKTPSCWSSPTTWTWSAASSAA